MNKISCTVICLIGLVMILCMDGLGAGTATITTLNNCHGSYFSTIGGYKASDGNIFLVVGLDISYSGSDTFSVDPSFFSATINNFDWKSSPATYDLSAIGLNRLPTGTLRNGGKATGYVAYEVPGSRDSFRIVYTGWDSVQPSYRCG
ncbi:Uncharacterised protein [uncultured archaeon]|nr:Uncharacterised protein [uncultured archaeon]